MFDINKYISYFYHLNLYKNLENVREMKRYSFDT